MADERNHYSGPSAPGLEIAVFGKMNKLVDISWYKFFDVRGLPSQPWFVPHGTFLDKFAGDRFRSGGWTPPVPIDIECRVCHPGASLSSSLPIARDELPLPRSSVRNNFSGVSDTGFAMSRRRALPPQPLSLREWGA